MSMFPRLEFHAALSLALAAAAPPTADERPMDGLIKAGVQDVICFDFWPGNSLRIVGTNGRRLAVVYCTVAGLPTAGKFLVSLENAQQLLAGLNPLAPEPINMQLFGENQLLFTGGPVEAVLVDRHPGIFPEYHALVEGQTPAALGAVYDLGTLRWILDHAATVGTGAISIHIREHGATTFRVKLRDQMQAIQAVLLAVKPFHTGGCR